MKPDIKLAFCQLVGLFPIKMLFTLYSNHKLCFDKSKHIDIDKWTFVLLKCWNVGCLNLHHMYFWSNDQYCCLINQLVAQQCIIIKDIICKCEQWNKPLRCCKTHSETTIKDNNVHDYDCFSVITYSKP